MTLLSEFQALQEEMVHARSVAEAIGALGDRHEEQINVLRSALGDVVGEIRALRRAAYWMAGIIVLAVSVLTLVGS